ncbi:MAG: hypothetical protein AAB772_00040 [Patescibacteria group bacterium]
MSRRFKKFFTPEIFFLISAFLMLAALVIGVFFALKFLANNINLALSRPETNGENTAADFDFEGFQSLNLIK